MQHNHQKYHSFKFDIRERSAYNNPQRCKSKNLNAVGYTFSALTAKTKEKLMHFKKLTKKKLNMVARNVAALSVMMMVCVGSVITVMAKTVEVTILDNDETTSISMMDPSKDAVLDTAIRYQRIDAVNDDDSVVFDSDSNTLTIRRGIDVTVTADGESRTVDMYYGDTVAQAVSKAGFVCGENDKLSMNSDEVLTENSEISLTRYYHVNVISDGETHKLLLQEGDVQSALDAASVTLGKEDSADAKLDAPLTEGMEIHISRVTYEEETQTESVDYAVKEVDSSSLYVGETKVQTKGVEGERTIVYRNKLVNGNVVDTEEISNEITKEPVDKVVLVGTKKRPSGYASISSDGTLVDHNGNQVSYKRALTGRCTAYTGGGWTATGRPAQYGNIAVNPDVIPYGSKLYICSPDGSTVYGYATAADTGGFASMGYIMADLYYDTYQECANFGVREMTIYVLS